MRYFDVLYGAVDLDGVVQEILDRCWEVRRLNNVGMMNFRSIALHPLTHCTRFEHAVGVAYLAQRYAEANRLDPIKRRTLIAAALMHDVSCSPFGHSIEWALIAGGHSVSHEEAAEWAATTRLTSATRGGAPFLDSPAFSPDAFGLDGDLFKLLQDGAIGHTEIKSEHMDLDNIDNVFRMAHYMGMEGASKGNAFKLVDALSMRPEAKILSIHDDATDRAILWQRLRHEVYKTFIYHNEYLSFEGQIFELVEALASLLDPRELRNLSSSPDDVLLWNYFRDDTFAELRPLLRRLIANHPYHQIYVGRAEAADLCRRLPSSDETRRLKSLFVETMLADPRAAFGSDPHKSEGPLKTWARAAARRQSILPPPLHIHVTTDARKTARRIDLSAYGADGTHHPVSIGEDRLFVVATVMSEVAFSHLDHDAIATCFKSAFELWAGTAIEDIDSETARRPQCQLSLGI